MASGIAAKGPVTSGSAGSDVRIRVRDVLAHHGRLAGPVDQLTDTCDLYRAGLTSLATVGLMLALEEEFDIEFPDAMLSRKTFSSIESLVSAVSTLRTG
jgi:acyl carrier protein